MANLRLTEGQLLAGLERAAERAHENLRVYVDEVRREVKEAAATLRDLPDTAPLLAKALAVLSTDAEFGGWHPQGDPAGHQIIITVNGQGFQMGDARFTAKRARLLLLVLPVEEERKPR